MVTKSPYSENYIERKRFKGKSMDELASSARDWNRSANKALVSGVILLITGIGFVIILFGLFLKWGANRRKKEWERRRLIQLQRDGVQDISRDTQVTSTASRPNYCKSCGINVNSKFCTNCGTQMI